MNATIWVSAATAFIIAAGGALGVVVASGNIINWQAIVASAALGAVTAAKDIRSSLRLPPINGNGNGKEESKPA